MRGSKGVAALRAERDGPIRLEALKRLAAACDECGIRLPPPAVDIGGAEHRSVRMQIAQGITLVTDADDWGTWSLWCGPDRIGLYATAIEALVEAKRRGWISGLL